MDYVRLKIYDSVYKRLIKEVKKLKELESFEKHLKKSFPTRDGYSLKEKKKN